MRLWAGEGILMRRRGDPLLPTEFSPGQLFYRFDARSLSGAEGDGDGGEDEADFGSL